MKKLLLTILIYTIISLTGKAAEEIQVNYIEKPQYVMDENRPHLTVPVNFGKSILLDAAQLKTLDMNSVYQIDLVYTRFKRRADFDQTKLNAERMEQLILAAPQINADAPIWNYVSQTAAVEAAEAERLFHGFVIYYRPKAPVYSDLKARFSPYRENLTQVFKIDNAIGGSFEYTSGTQVNVPAGAAVHTNGERVEGEYEIHYAEYRNAADIALSGIPMTFTENGEDLTFSSIGMYEINGQKNNEPVLLQHPVTVDFNTTKVVDDASFYQLNEKDEAWKWVKPIPESDFGMNKSDIAFAQGVGNLDFVQPLELEPWKSPKIRGRQCTLKQSDDFPEDCEVILNAKAWEKYKALLAKGDLDSLVERTDDPANTLYTSATNFRPLLRQIIGKRFVQKKERGMWHFGLASEIGIPNIAPVDDGNRTKGTMLASGIDKGHTYPNIVKGLNTPEFGVYNCDQIYRLGKTERMHPVYVDAETGDKISGGHVACLMDLNYNGSFSFDPQYITYNPSGKNALLLTASNNRFYLILPEAFAACQTQGENPTLQMVDVTKKLKTTADLKTMLGI